MKYKLLACDLDGPLLDDNSNVSAENLNAIDEMVKLGVEFAICTGRTYDEIPKALLDNKSIRYINIILKLLKIRDLVLIH